MHRLLCTALFYDKGYKYIRTGRMAQKSVLGNAEAEKLDWPVCDSTSVLLYSYK